MHTSCTTHARDVCRRARVPCVTCDARGRRGNRASSRCPARWARTGRAARSARQNSMPSCAFTPAAKWCLAWPISVTRSAAASSVGLGVAAGDDDVQVGAAGGERGDDAAEVEVVVAQRDVELVEDRGARCVGSAISASAFAQARSAAATSRAQVLGLPGEALAHGVPGDPVAEGGERVALAGVPGALDELHDADAAAVAEHAQREAEGGGATCPCRGRCGRSAGPSRWSCRRPRRPAPPCAWPSSPCGARRRRRRSRSSHFTCSGRPATISTTRSATAATRWLSRPAASRKRRASAFSGTMPRPTSFETTTQGPRGRASAAARRVGLGRRGRGRRACRLREPERQAVDEHRPAGGAAGERRGERRAAPRAVSQPAPRRARCAAMRAAISASSGLGGGEVEPGAGRGGDQRLGVRALAGAGAAEDEGRAGRQASRALRRRRARRRSAAGPALTA